jgi:hypothetical protein
MRQTFRAAIFAAIALPLLSACSETSLPQATGKGTINAINAMSASPTVSFLIEERPLGNIGFASALGRVPFDDLTYTFNFEYVPLGESEPIRIASQFVDVLADTDYTLVITGSVTAPTVTQWESGEREFDEGTTVFEAAFSHLAPTIGDVDVYLGLTGTPPVIGEERAKLSNGDLSTPLDLEAEEYELTITAPDDPATVLYKSYPTMLTAALSFKFVIFDADPSITGAMRVRAITAGGPGFIMPDSTNLPTLRTVHAAFGTENVDIYRDEDFTTPIVSDLAFSMDTGDIPVPDGGVTYTYTAVGNPSVIIEEQIQTVPRGARVTSILAGMQGTDLLAITLTDNRRSVETYAKLRLIQAAANFESMDLYLVETGTDISDINPLFSGLTFAAVSDFSPTIP